MLIYYGDGTRTGFLSLLYCALRDHPAPDDVCATLPAQCDLLAEYRPIPPDERQAQTLLDVLAARVSAQCRQNVLWLFRAGDPKSASIAYRYLRMAAQLHGRVDLYHSHPDVRDALALCRRVGFEVHRLSGLARFKELDGGVYYARLEPDHDVIDLLGEFFHERMGDQPFILHDSSRKKAVLSRQGRIACAPLEDAQPNFSQQEHFLQRMWKNYFRAMAIESRISAKRQRMHMPQRYWKNLVEFEG